MIRGILELLRPANVTTALADVLAGFAVAGLANARALPWLLLSTACLYAGGVVLNDVFDRRVDRVERPERPIPSGRVPVGLAAALGSVLLAGGILLARQATPAAGTIAAAVAGFVLLYDAWGKQHLVVGPINMGLCRALNLLLGMAAVPEAIGASWPLAFIPLFYISGVTLLSRGEVHGGSGQLASAAFVASSVSLLALLFVAAGAGERLPAALALALVAAGCVVPPFWRARETPEPAIIKAAVRRGVLSLVLIDATIGAAYAGPVYAAAIVATGVLAGWLAKVFAVT